MTSADVFTQKVLEERTDVDCRRIAAFASFGIVQIGVIQYHIMSRLLPVMFPYTSIFAAKSLVEKACDMRGILGICAMTVFHEALITPFEILPAFYIFKELCQGPGGGEFSDFIGRAIGRYSENFWEDNMQSLKLFVPANLVNFFLMPVHLRVPFATMCGFVWAVLLSLSRGTTEFVSLETLACHNSQLPGASDGGRACALGGSLMESW